MVIPVTAILGYLGGYCISDDSGYLTLGDSASSGSLLGQMAFKYLKSRRETTIRNLEVCFPEWSAQEFRTMPYGLY